MSKLQCKGNNKFTSSISNDPFTKMPWYSSYLFCKFPNVNCPIINKICSKKDCPSFVQVYLTLKCMVCKKEKK